MRAFKNRVSTKRRREIRLTKLLAGLESLKVPITTTSSDPQANGQLVFSDNVANRFDDGDPKTLERYALVLYEDARYADYLVHSFRTLRGLKSELEEYFETSYVTAIDLDAGIVLRPAWKTTVRFGKPVRKRGGHEARNAE